MSKTNPELLYNDVNEGTGNFGLSMLQGNTMSLLRRLFKTPRIEFNKINPMNQKETKKEENRRDREYRREGPNSNSNAELCIEFSRAKKSQQQGRGQQPLKHQVNTANTW